MHRVGEHVYGLDGGNAVVFAEDGQVAGLGVNAVCPSISSRKRTRFAQGSVVKSTLPFFIVICRVADLRGVPTLGQIISTVRRLREIGSAFSGIPARERDLRVISTDVFIVRV